MSNDESLPFATHISSLSSSGAFKDSLKPLFPGFVKTTRLKTTS